MTSYQRRGDLARYAAGAIVAELDRIATTRALTDVERRARIAAAAAAEFLERTAHETEPPDYLREL